MGTPFFGNAIYVIVFHFCYLDCEFISPFLKNLPIFFFIFGCFFGYFSYTLFNKIIFEHKQFFIYGFFLYF